MLFQTGMIGQGFEDMVMTPPHIVLVVDASNEHAKFGGIVRTIHIQDSFNFSLQGLRPLGVSQ
jgi:hypothetical protein